MPRVSRQYNKTNTRPKKGIGSRIKSLGEGLGSTIKALLYGKSGTGKTTVCSSFPGKILWAVCSGGNKPGELRSLNTPTLRKKIDQIVIEDSSDVQEVVDYQTENDYYKTLVLDHSSGLQDLILKEILGLDEAPVQLSWGLASQQQYGQVALQMKERLRSLLNLDCNVLIIAQEREFNNDNSDDLLMPFVGAALTPSIVGWLNPACDYIMQTFIRPIIGEKETKIGEKSVTTKAKTGEVEYCLRTGPHDVYTTKFRRPKGKELPAVIVDPDYNKLKKYLGD